MDSAQAFLTPLLRGYAPTHHYRTSPLVQHPLRPPHVQAAATSQSQGQRSTLRLLASLVLGSAASLLSFQRQERRGRAFGNLQVTTGRPASAVVRQASEAAYPDQTYPSADYAIALGKFMADDGRLEWKDAERLVKDATDILKSEATLEEVQVPAGGHLNVIGDTHGQFFDLLGIFEQFGYPSETNPFLFNGDFVDRGSYSVEVLLLLLAWKVAYPSHVRLGRGNHEEHSMNLYYGFTGEVLTKYGLPAYWEMQTLFRVLPLAHVVNGETFIVHGGLPRTSDGLNEIRSYDRSAEDGSTLQRDLLWADPRDVKGFEPGSRGGDTMTFGPDVTEEFLKANKLKLLIRSHEVRDEGFSWEHNGKCLTVFSAPNYCDSIGNLGAVARLSAGEDGSLTTSIETFKAKPRTIFVPSMAYSPLSRYYGLFMPPDARQQLEKLVAIYSGSD